MKTKIDKNLKSGVYVKIGNETALCPSYLNTERGWVNYLIGDIITFSHRQNNYEAYSYPYSLEYHDNYELLIYHTGDDIQYIADGQYFIVPQHSALLIKPYTMHMLRLPSPIICERYVLNFKQLDGLFPDASVLGFLKRGSTNCALFYDERYDFVKLSQSIENALSDDGSSFQNAGALIRIIELFMALSDSKMLEGVGRDRLSQVSSVPQKILAVKEYIDVEFLNIKSIPKLAERFHYNREHLSRSFHKYFGIPVYGYILRRRLMYARELMITGEQAMIAAQKAGFNNYASFSERFRKQFGCSPSEYKNTLLSAFK